MKEESLRVWSAAAGSALQGFIKQRAPIQRECGEERGGGRGRVAGKRRWVGTEVGDFIFNFNFFPGLNVLFWRKGFSKLFKISFPTNNLHGIVSKCSILTVNNVKPSWCSICSSKCSSHFSHFYFAWKWHFSCLQRVSSDVWYHSICPPKYEATTSSRVT